MFYRLLYAISLIFVLGIISCGATQESIVEDYPYSRKIMSPLNQPLFSPECSKPLALTLWDNPSLNSESYQPLVVIPEDVLAKIMLSIGQNALWLAFTCSDSYLVFNKISIFALQRTIYNSFNEMANILTKSLLIKEIPNLESPEDKQGKLQKYAHLRRNQEQNLKRICEKRKEIAQNYPENDELEIEVLHNIETHALHSENRLEPQVHSLIKEIEDDPACCQPQGVIDDLAYLAQESNYNLRGSIVNCCGLYKKLVRNKYFLMGSMAVVGGTIFIGGYYLYQYLNPSGLIAKEVFYNQTSVSRLTYVGIENYKGYICPGGLKDFYSNCLGKTYWSQSPQPHYNYFDSSSSGCHGYVVNGSIADWLNFVQERCGINTSFWSDRINLRMGEKFYDLQNSFCSKNPDNTSISCGNIWLRGHNFPCLTDCDLEGNVIPWSRLCREISCPEPCEGDICMEIVRGIPDLARQTVLAPLNVYTGLTGTFIIFYTTMMILSYFYC